MLFSEHPLKHECPLRDKGTKQVPRIPRSAVQEICTVYMENTFELVAPTERLIEPKTLWGTHQITF